MSAHDGRRAFVGVERESHYFFITAKVAMSDTGMVIIGAIATAARRFEEQQNDETSRISVVSKKMFSEVRRWKRKRKSVVRVC